MKQELTEAPKTSADQDALILEALDKIVTVLRKGL